MDWKLSPPIILSLAIAVGLLSNSGNRERPPGSAAISTPSSYQLLADRSTPTPSVSPSVNSSPASVQWPSTGAPSNTIDLGTRGPRNCDKRGCLLAVLPVNEREWLTTAVYPHLLFYLPQTAAGRPVELYLFPDDNHAQTYSLIIPAPSTSGIISFDLSTLKDSQGKNLPPLKIGKKYRWSLAIVFDPRDHSQDLLVEGAIARQPIDSKLAELLRQASPRKRAALYAANNFWYDALATLYQQRQSHPDDRASIADWTNLLKAIDLSSIARSPLIK